MYFIKPKLCDSLLKIIIMTYSIAPNIHGIKLP